MSWWAPSQLPLGGLGEPEPQEPETNLALSVALSDPALAVADDNNNPAYRLDFAHPDYADPAFVMPNTFPGFLISQQTDAIHHHPNYDPENRPAHPENLVDYHDEFGIPREVETDQRHPSWWMLKDTTHNLDMAICRLFRPLRHSQGPLTYIRAECSSSIHQNRAAVFRIRRASSSGNPAARVQRDPASLRAIYDAVVTLERRIQAFKQPNSDWQRTFYRARRFLEAAWEQRAVLILNETPPQLREAIWDYERWWTTEGREWARGCVRQLMGEVDAVYRMVGHRIANRDLRDE